MSNYNSLKTTIDANIKQNGRQEITGQILNSVLNQMVTTLGAGYQFAGVATTATNPGTPDAKVFYIANGKGTYTNFGGIEVTEDEVVVLYWDSSWHKVSTGIASADKLNQLGQYLTITGNFSSFRYQSLFTYGTDENNEIITATDTYDGIVMYIPAGIQQIALNQFNGFIWAYAYSTYPTIGLTGGVRCTETAEDNKRIINVGTNANGLWIIITLQKTNADISSIILYGNFYNALQKTKNQLEENIIDSTLNANIGNFITGFKNAHLRTIFPDNRVDTEYSHFTGILIYVPAGILSLSFVQTNMFVWACAYDTIPVVNDSGDVVTFKTENNITTFFLESNANGKYLLITVNKSNGDISTDIKMYPLQYSAKKNIDEHLHISERISLDDFTGQSRGYFDGTGWIEQDGTINVGGSWKNGYIPVGGCDCVYVNHIAVNTYSSTYVFFCDQSKNPLVGYQISTGSIFVAIPENAQYLLAAFEEPSNISNQEFEILIYEKNTFFKLQQEIDDNNNDIADIKEEIRENVLIVVPSDLYAVKGKQLSLYYDAIVRDFDKGLSSPANYYVDIECPTLHAISSYVGVRRERMWQLYQYPNSRTQNIVGNYPLYIKVYNRAGSVVAEKTCTLHIIDNAGLSSAKNILCVGDSLTNNGPIVKTMADDFISAGGTQPTFIGQRETDGYHHEGYPGYTFQKFITNPGFNIYVFQVPVSANISVGDRYYVNGQWFDVVDIRQEYPTTKSIRCDGRGTPAQTGTMIFGSGSPTSDAEIEYSSVDIQGASPFYNENTGQVDIANYRSEMGMGNEKFDLVVIMLGTNDCLYTIKDMSDSVNAAKTLINAFISDAGTYPTKIILQLTPADANTISSWQVYPDQASISEKVAYWTNMWNLRKLLYEEFTKAEYSGKVWIGQAPLGLDRYYGYPYETFVSEDRINIQENYHTNSVHPNTAGYQQLGDQYFLQGLYLLKL